MTITKTIKHIIRWFLPFGIVRWYKLRSLARVNNVNNGFMASFRAYIESSDRCELADESPFEIIVSVQGFGFSGSGAVVDLLREYNSTLVVGNVDSEGSMSSREEHRPEVDILRLAGGLFEVEKYLGSNNVFQNDALLHRVVAQIEQSEIYQTLPATHPYFFEYFNRICTILMDAPLYQCYNRHLDYKRYNDFLYLKELSISNYRNICRQLLNSLFSVIKQNSDKSILVLDQFCGDCEYDYSRYEQYVPNLKLIAVYRDPRDVYAFARDNKVEWIPYEGVENFVAWYKMMTKCYNLKEKDTYYSVCFEDLLFKYIEVVCGIEQYIGLNSIDHVYKERNLCVSESAKNIGRWIKEDALQNDCDYILNELSEYCNL